MDIFQSNQTINTIAQILLLIVSGGIVFLAIVFGVHLIYVNLTRPKRPKRSLFGKHVVITGGSSGIGKAAAIECAKEGANVTIVARNLNILEAAQKDISQYIVGKDSQFVRVLQLDVSVSEACAEMLGGVDSTDPVFMLINCAGLAICGTLENLSQQSINTMVSVNLMGTINATKALVGAMKSRRAGVIVNVSSQGGLLGIYGYSVYAASKFAVRGFSEALDMEVRPYGIYVCVALPPDTDTAGFAIENISKPEETRLISEAAGLEQPQVVGARMVHDALSGRFFSYVGLESYMVTNMCTGFAPVHCLATVYWQAFILGPLRVITAVVTHHFHCIVYKCYVKRRN